MSCVGKYPCVSNYVEWVYIKSLRYIYPQTSPLAGECLIKLTSRLAAVNAHVSHVYNHGFMDTCKSLHKRLQKPLHYN